MRPKIIIFDLDGTLINTLGDLNASVNFALEKFNCPLRTLENTRNDIGNGVAKLIERSIPGGLANPNYEECLSIFRDHYSRHYFDKSLPYQGIKETLIKLKENGFLLGVVTNKFNEGAQKLMDYFFSGIFDMVQGEEPFYKKKPDPEMAFVLLNHFGLKAEEAIYVGDTEVDYQMAKTAQIPTILVAYGYRNRDVLEDKIKDVPIVGTPIELLDLLLD